MQARQRTRSRAERQSAFWNDVLEEDGVVVSEQDPSDGRSRRYRLTALGRQHWHERALPRIRDYYEEAVAGLSVEDMSDALHHLVRLLDNMTAIDEGGVSA